VKAYLTTFLFIIISSVNILTAQKVGVVLSGGGSKGYAHVGFLKALEENHIPIDFIAGTSMGAIVAGLYAVGYTPDQIKELLGSEEFYKWSQGLIDLNEEYYYKKKNELPDWLNFEFKRDSNEIKTQLPTNMIEPAQMDLRFLQYYAPGAAAAKYNFDSLMVPFFCVASDVHNNKPVIFRSGNLASSVRASMTFPGYFKPIAIDNNLLYDGGMQNNFPADLMKEIFKPDVIIGCKVTNNPKKPTADDVYLQLENIFMKPATFEIPGNGIIIEPNTKGYGIMDFNQFKPIYNIGYSATIARIDSIKHLINHTQDSVDLFKKRKAFSEKKPDLTFQNVYVTGVNHQSTDYILKNVKRNRYSVNFKEFENEYFKLLSDKLIKAIYPQAIFNPENSTYDLNLEIATKNTLTLKLGGNLSSSYRSMGFIGVDYVFQKKNIYNIAANMILGQFYNSLYGHFRLDFPPRTIKHNRANSPFYVDILIGMGRWDFFKTSDELFIDSEELSQVIHTDKYIATDIGFPVRNRGLIYGGFAYGQFDYNYFNTNLISQKDIADKTVMNYSSVHITYEYNTLNYRQYANHGAFFKVQLRYITGLEKYTPGTTAVIYDATEAKNGHSWINFKLTRERYFRMHRHFSLGYTAMLNLSDKGAFTNSISTLLSAPVYAPFPQSRVVVLEKYRATNWIGAGIIPVCSVADKFQIKGEFHAFQPYKYIYKSSFKPTFSDKFPTPRFMGCIALIYQTPVGPLAITGCYYYKEEIPYAFQINLGYVLFNRKGLD
jgi:NTE family protein